MSFGFIVLRHVNSEITNSYWNEAVMSIRKLYSPDIKIVVIDDNSKKEFVKEFFPYKNIEYVDSEFPQRGEILPFYYFLKNKYFDNAVIIHDSIFIKRKINFNKFKYMNINVMPLWHFEYGKDENIENTARILRSLTNNFQLMRNLYETNKYEVLGLKIANNYWDGCFGGICYINHDFLSTLQRKYNISNMVNVVKNKTDRCGLERIIGLLFCAECPKLKSFHSFFGNIHNYKRGEYSWGYTYQQHRNFMSKYKRPPVPVVKVWSGR